MDNIRVEGKRVTISNYNTLTIDCNGELTMSVYSYKTNITTDHNIATVIPTIPLTLEEVNSKCSSSELDINYDPFEPPLLLQSDGYQKLTIFVNEGYDSYFIFIDINGVYILRASVCFSVELSIAYYWIEHEHIFSEKHFISFNTGTKSSRSVI